MAVEFKPCPKCNGYGILDNGNSCRKCGGSGEIMFDSETGQRITAKQLVARMIREKA